MTGTLPSPHLAYDDLTSPQEMSIDCQVVGRNLRLAQAARAAVKPAPSIHFEDFPQDVAKREIRIPEAAARLANALQLHLD